MKAQAEMFCSDEWSLLRLMRDTAPKHLQPVICSELGGVHTCRSCGGRGWVRSSQALDVQACGEVLGYGPKLSPERGDS